LIGEFFFIYDVTFVIDSITRAKIFIICACIWFVLIKFALLLRSAVIVVVNNSTVSLFNISGAGSSVSWHFLECCHKPFLDKYGLLHRLQGYVFRDDVSSVVAGWSDSCIDNNKSSTGWKVMDVFLCLFVFKWAL
jgi:hypothetical protein